MSSRISWFGCSASSGSQAPPFSSAQPFYRWASSRDCWQDRGALTRGTPRHSIHALPSSHCPSDLAFVVFSLSSPSSGTCSRFTHASGLLPRGLCTCGPLYLQCSFHTCPPGSLISPSGPYLNITFSVRHALTTLFKIITNSPSPSPQRVTASNKGSIPLPLGLPLPRSCAPGAWRLIRLPPSSLPSGPSRMSGPWIPWRKEGHETDNIQTKKWGRKDVFKDGVPICRPRPQPSPTRILTTFFLCGASTSNQQEGTFFGSSVGMGSASVGEG